MPDATSALLRARRFALPGLLLGTTVLAMTGLAALPSPAAPAGSLLAAQSSGLSGAGSLAALRNDLAPPVVPVAPRVSPAKPAATAVKTTPKAEPRPSAAKRASRSRPAPRVAAVERISTDGYACPVAGRHSFTDTWGAARSGGRSHQGTDLMAAYGTPLAAVTSGVVRTASSGAGGISLYLRGDDGVTYFYAHNSRNSVSSGERVKAGEIVGAVGTSGNAPESAPHLHFERNPGGGPVNPYSFLRRIC